MPQCLGKIQTSNVSWGTKKINCFLADESRVADSDALTTDVGELSQRILIRGPRAGVEFGSFGQANRGCGKDPCSIVHPGSLAFQG
jgi:hypothetical protein